MNAGTRIICREGTGFPLVKMWLPDDWRESVTVNPKVITGSGEPEFITVTAVSRDRCSKITWQSSFHYRDDYLSEQTDCTDSYGNMRRRFLTAEEFIDYLASRDFNRDCTDVTVFLEKDWDNNRAHFDQFLKDTVSYSGNDPYTAIGDVYCHGMQRGYAYRYRGMPRKRLYSLAVKAVEYAYWAPVPDSIVRSLDDPSMASAAEAVLEQFPNARYDRQKNEWVYTIAWFRDWRIDQRIIMDTPEDRFDDLRQTVLRPVVSHGVYYTDELRAATAETQRRINEENRIKREMYRKNALQHL